MFVYSNFAKRLTSFKQSYSVLFDGSKRREYFTDEDCDALWRLNTLFFPLIGKVGADSFYPDMYSNEPPLARSVGDFDSVWIQDSLAIAECYMSNCIQNEDEIKQLIEDPNTQEYPYFHNVIDTKAIPGLFYEIKCVDRDKYIVILYKEFLEHVGSKDINNLKNFIKHLLVKLHETMTISEISTLPLFTKYLQLLNAQ
jgi:hypothetical protein